MQKSCRIFPLGDVSHGYSSVDIIGMAAAILLLLYRKRNIPILKYRQLSRLRCITSIHLSTLHLYYLLYSSVRVPHSVDAPDTHTIENNIFFVVVLDAERVTSLSTHYST